MGIPNLGPKYVSGDVSTGRVVLTRDDGSTDNALLIMFMGTITDVTGDGVFDINFPGGS